MASIVGRVSDLAARLVLWPARVATVTDHGDFRMIDFAGERFRTAEWVPGDKLRVRADDLALRTYTPVSCDAGSGRARVLAYVHGSGPGSDWCRNVHPGDACQLRGPERSVRLDRLSAPPVFVGDETSFGLLLALHGGEQGSGPAVAASLFEVTNADESGLVLAEYGASATDLVVRVEAEAHRDELARRVLDAVRANPDAPLVLTGRAQTIATLRRVLKAEGVAAPDTIVKAYWDENRKGLD